MSVHPSAEIHPTAIVEAGATVAAGCRIGPYCVVGGDVELGESVHLHSHVVIAGWTRIGPQTAVFPFACLGTVPQDLKYAGERTELIVGARNRIREYVTMSPGTAGGGGVTRVGDDGLYMANTHVGHDCTIGDRVIMANCVSIAGHVGIGDGAVLGGLAGVHQHVRIGQGAMIGGLAAVPADVVPYGMVAGDRAQLIGLNLVGLKRRGFGKSAINELRAAFDDMFGGEGTMMDRMRAAQQRHADNPLVAEIAEFVLGQSSRSYTLPPGRRAG